MDFHPIIEEVSDSVNEQINSVLFLAKEEAEAKQKAENSFSKEDMEHIKAFWKARTHIKMIGEK